MGSPSVRIFQAPKLLDLASADALSIALAERCRAFRLHGLKTAPEAFASSYDAEVEMPLDFTWQRLTNPRARTFVAVRPKAGAEMPKGSTEEILLSPSIEWLGNIALLGPMRDHTAQKIADMRAPANASAEIGYINDLVRRDLATGWENEEYGDTMHFFVGGMFVDLPARRMGVGLQLINAVLEDAKTRARKEGLKALNVAIMVEEFNDAARLLYEKAGFVAKGRSNFIQQKRDLPEGEVQRAERVALYMEYRYSDC